MLTVLYSYAAASSSRSPEEQRLYAEEIAGASTDRVRFVPFDHRAPLGGARYLESAELDRDYRANHPRLRALHAALEAAIARTGATCLFVTNDQVYHPDYLLRLPIYRAYHTTDDPGATYLRTIPFIHAFHHIFHCALPYGPDKTLRQKLLECGARAVDFLPLGAFDYEMDAGQTEETILARPRDIDFVYIGNPFFAQKFDGFLKLTRAFGERLQLYGFWKAKHSVYLSLHARRKIWVRPVSFVERVQLYQRAKIGFNMHWDAWGLGNQRLYHLPANGVMQICDCPELLGEIFEKGREVVPAASFDEMVDRGRYYLEHDRERRDLALAGFRRVQRDYRIRTVMEKLAEALERGMAAQGLSGGEGRPAGALAGATRAPPG